MLEFPGKLARDISAVNYGTHELKPVYRAPLLAIDGVLNVCSRCLSLCPSPSSLLKHMETCTIPFRAIYEEEEFGISRVTPIGRKQNLCLLSQMFLKSKTVYFEVRNYDFFVVYRDEIFGYFSRYKGGDHALNCFLVFPCFQRQGWGTILLDYSQIKISSNHIGAEPPEPAGPRGAEKPYSKKAICCFRKYWRYKVIGAKSIRHISEERNMSIDDAILGLEQQGFNFRRWKLEGTIDARKPRLLSKKAYRKDSP